MTLNGWIQIAIYCAIIVALVKPLGWYMTAVFNGERTFLSPILRAVEAGLYRLGGVDEGREQDWLTYTVAMLLFHVAGFLILYGLLRLQGFLPFNPQGMTAVPEYLSFNTAISFITNTNWQNYGGESTLSYLVQMLGLTHQNFLSAATGIVLAVALIRGFSRASSKTIGNFWVDITRCTLYILLPICIPFALFLVWQGMPQTLGAYVDATTLEGAKQTIAVGPVASQVAIKMLGTNGGGFFNANAAHPVRESDGAVQSAPDRVDLRYRRRAHQCVRPHGRRSAPRLGHLRRHGRDLRRRRPRHLLGRGSGQSAIRKPRARSGEHGRQGGALRRAAVCSVRGDHHGCLLRRRQCHARQLHPAWRHDPADQHGAWRDCRRRRRRRPLRHADLRRHHHLRRRPHGRPHAGICRQEDRGEGSQDGDAGAFWCCR